MIWTVKRGLDLSDVSNQSVPNTTQDIVLVAVTFKAMAKGHRRRIGTTTATTTIPLLTPPHGSGVRGYKTDSSNSGEEEYSHRYDMGGIFLAEIRLALLN